MPDEMSVSRIVFDRDENHLPCSDADRDWLIAEVESLEAELKDDRGVRAVVMNEQYAELDGLPEKSMRIYEAIRSLRQQVERLEAEREGKHPARGDYVERAKFRDTIAKQAHAEVMEAAVGICRRWDDEWMLDCGCASTIADKIAAAKETT